MGNGCSIYLACVVLWMEITIKGALCIQRIFLGFFTIFILEYSIHTVYVGVVASQVGFFEASRSLLTTDIKNRVPT